MTKYIIALSFLLPLAANARGFNGSISFSATEKAEHARKADDFKEIAASCLTNFKREHKRFYKDMCERGKCLSKFYGSRRYSKRHGKTRSDGTPLKYLGDALLEAGFAESYMNDMTSTSCIGMSMDCLGEAFVKTGQKEQWDKMKYFVSRLNHTYGTALLHALQQIGWTVYYWNPSTDRAEMNKWHQQELGPVVSADYSGKKVKTKVDGETVYRGRWDSIGYHRHRFDNVMKKNKYWTNLVDNKTDMVGFGKQTPEILHSAPFWVGIANTGYHVFPGTYSDVIEAHSTRHITSKDNMEFSTFNPMASGGGPRWSGKEKYRSGLIALPPGVSGRRAVSKPASRKPQKKISDRVADAILNGTGGLY